MSDMTTADPPERTDPLRDKRILIVEDHPDSREVLAWALRALRAKVLTAVNVADAQRFILLERPHLIICDIALPGESGLDLITWLRGLATPLSSIPCIAVTAFSEQYPPITARGFDAYMRKPLDVGKLCTVVASLVQ